MPETVEQPLETTETPKPKFRREIQPKDDDGNPIGAPHVYEAESEQELLDKMAEAIGNGTKKIRELTRQAKYAPIEAPKPKEGAEPAEEIPEFKPRQLTAEEKFELAQQLRDPEKMDEAFDRLYEARTGRKPAEAAKVEQEIYINSRKAREKAETEAFIESHPEYYQCEKNKLAIIDYIARNNLAWRAKNLEIAYKELETDGLLVSAPVAAPEPPPETRTEPPAKTKTAFPSAITRDTASGSGAPPKAKKPSAAELAMMTAAEYKEFVTTGRWTSRA